MPDFRKLLGTSYLSTGSFIHRAADQTFFSAIDFQKLSRFDQTPWEKFFRGYLNFYSLQLFKTMKGKMNLAEVGVVVQTAWQMRSRSVYVFKTRQHPWAHETSYLAGVGHVRGDGPEQLLPSEADGITMPRTESKGLEIGRFLLCPELPVDEKRGVIESLLKLYAPVLSLDLRFKDMSLRTSRAHSRYYQKVFAEFLDRKHISFLKGDRDVILKLDPDTLRTYVPLALKDTEGPSEERLPSDLQFGT